MTETKVERVKIGDEEIFVEVVEGQVAEDSGYEESATEGELLDAGERIRGTIRALAATVSEALANAPPKEWTLEINIGFKGKAGIPFVTEGEANGAVKVTAKWVK